MALEVIVLAGGAGTRMRSRLPKVLHPLGGRPLLAHVLDATAGLAPSAIHVVVGEQGDEIRAAFAGREDVSWVLQRPALGTGHAVAQALPAAAEDATVLVLIGDAPLIATETLAAVAHAGQEGVAIVTAELANPAGFGRILREDGEIVGIVEEADATAGQRAIHEANAGILAAPKQALAALIESLAPANAQAELYLTDVVGVAVGQGQHVAGIAAATPEEILGVNDRAQLARLERCYQRRQADRLMAAGVTVMDPARLDVRGTVTAGEDCVIDVGVLFEGSVTLGRGVTVGAGCVIRDADLGDDVNVLPMSCINGAVVAAGCRIGPFARLRPGTRLAADVHIGNFVETKQAALGAGAKANHLAYLGDASVGAGSNIGAGAITCNYDGEAKHRTEIGSRAFVGTNATLVAPLAIGDDAYVGAGSTITGDVPAEELAIGRGRQRNIKGWTPPAHRRAGS